MIKLISLPARLLIAIAALSAAIYGCAGNTKNQSQAQQEALSPGAALLFKRAKTKLSITARNNVFKAFGLALSKDGNAFVDPADSAAIEPFSATAYPVDLNGDGREEIFIDYGSVSYSGVAGGSMELVMSVDSTYYTKALDESGFFVVMPDKSGGYPDLLVGGPGFSFQVYRWDGVRYLPSKKISDAALRRIKTQEVEKMSTAYQATL